jgi:hypothetical protein
MPELVLPNVNPGNDYWTVKGQAKFSTLVNLRRRNEVCVWRLVDCPRTRDEDVHESSGALQPVKTGCHVEDADKSAEQLEWLEISTNVVALDCALHQRINRSLASENLADSRLWDPRPGAYDVTERRTRLSTGPVQFRRG